LVKNQATPDTFPPPREQKEGGYGKGGEPLTKKPRQKLYGKKNKAVQKKGSQ